MASDSTRLSPRAHFVVKIRETRQCRASGPVWSFALQLSTTCTSPAEKNLVYCSPRRSAGRLEICLFTCKLIREHVVHKSAERQHTLRNKCSKRALFEERVHLEFFVRRFHKESFLSFLKERGFQQSTKSSFVKGSLYHNITGFSEEAPWWVLDTTLEI